MLGKREVGKCENKGARPEMTVQGKNTEEQRTGASKALRAKDPAKREGAMARPGLVHDRTMCHIHKTPIT